MKLRAFLAAQMVKNLSSMQETQICSLSREDPWREPWQTTPVFLPGEFYGQTMGSLRVGHNCATNIHILCLIEIMGISTGQLYSC